MKEFYKNKKVLIAGGTGFIGRNLIEKLITLGATVTATNFTQDIFITKENINFLRVDLTNYDSCLKATKDIDYVFMLAANTSGAAVIQKEPLAHLTPNVVMNSYMLAASYQNNVNKFCFVSSNTVYPVTDFPVKENDVNYKFFEKYHVVGWMKLFSEKMCEMYSEKISKKMSTLVVRPANLYGPYDKYTYKESKVIAALIRRAVERDNPFIVWGDGSDLKEFLYIEDFINTLVNIFSSDEKGPINISANQPVTIREVIGEILKAANFTNANVKFDESKPTMIPKRLISNDKMLKVYPSFFATPISEGIHKTVNWYKNVYNKQSPEDYKECL